MILTQQPLYAANTHDPFGVSNCDATRSHMDVIETTRRMVDPILRCSLRTGLSVDGLISFLRTTQAWRGRLQRLLPLIPFGGREGLDG